jgi:hypothetical protein
MRRNTHIYKDILTAKIGRAIQWVNDPRRCFFSWLAKGKLFCRLCLGQVGAFFPYKGMRRVFFSQGPNDFFLTFAVYLYV